MRRQKAVRVLDFSDVNPRVCSQNSVGELDSENLTACNAPDRHVSFPETAEVVEFDPASPDAEVQPAPVAEHDAQAPDVTCAAHAHVAEYDVPAPNMAYRVHAAPAPVVEKYEAAPSMAYLVHSAPAPVVEYDTPVVTATYRVHAAPAPVVEYAPAPNMAYRVHAAPAPEVTPAPDVAYRAHAAPAPVVKCDAPAPTVTYREHAASAPEVTPAPDVTYRAHAAAAPVVTPAPTMAYRVPEELVEDLFTAMMDKFIEKLDEPGVDASDEDENFISMTRLKEMNYAALTIQRGWRWTHKRIVLRAASEERLQEKLRVVRRRLVACLPVGASAKEMKSTLKAVEKEWRMLFNEELANLELDLGVRSRRVEW